LGPNRTVIVTPREVSETERVFTAEKILIATGSRPFHPANIPFDDPDIFDSEELPKIDQKLELANECMEPYYLDH
jgi:pyruvate/2-oxoglutarate dehydrogenase complex dihydrolipoamide dehydrogenase (E3) component